MKAQLLGIHISLMVHAMAIMLVYAASQGMTPAVRTVALDFSLDAGGQVGEKGSAAGGGSGGDEAQLREKAPPPKDSAANRKIVPAIDPEDTRLSGVAEPPPLVSEERPPLLAEPPPVPKETPPVAQKPPPAHRMVKDGKRIAVNKTISPKIVRTKPVSWKNRLEPIPEKKTDTDPPVQAARVTPAPVQVNSPPEKKPKPVLPMPTPTAGSDSLSTVPDAVAVATADRFAASTDSGKGLSAARPEQDGSDSRGGLAGRGAENGESLSGDGGSAYLKSHFNFIRGHLREHLCYPSIARKRGWSGEVMVAFTIYPDGRADDVAIQKSCGISLLDKSAVKTVHNACPFPLPPMAARIVIPIVYQLN